MANFDKHLSPILDLASNEDLDPLVGYISKAFSESLTSNSVYKACSPNHQKYAHVIGQEIKSFGGNTFVNFFRGAGASYFEVVCDVASNVKATYSKSDSIEEIELAIIMHIAENAWDQMTDDERLKFLSEMGIQNKFGAIPKALPVAALQVAIQASGFIAYKMTVIVANAIAKAILGRGLMFATNATLTRGLSLFAGPIGWAVMGAWTAIDIAGPAYRVTMPCVIHIATLRQKFSLSSCPKCAEKYKSGSAFCSKCGSSLNESSNMIY